MNFTETHACRNRIACADCRSRPEWRAAMGAPEICPYGVGATQNETPPKMNPELCRSRAHCVRCRTSKAWREANNAPEVCPFAAESEVINHAPLKRVHTVEASVAECRSYACNAFDPAKGCNSCGCRSEPHRPIEQVKICPRKWWIRTVSEGKIET